MTIQEFINTKTTKYTSVTIEYKGYEFSASINYSKHYIWDKDGGKTVYNWNGELPISQEKLEQLLQWTIDGQRFCCQCLEKIDGDNWGSFYAGIYCSKCWAKNKAEDKDFGNYGRLD